LRPSDRCADIWALLSLPYPDADLGEAPYRSRAVFGPLPRRLEQGRGDDLRAVHRWERTMWSMSGLALSPGFRRLARGTEAPGEGQPRLDLGLELSRRRGLESVSTQLEHQDPSQITRAAVKAVDVAADILPALLVLSDGRMGILQRDVEQALSRALTAKPPGRPKGRVSKCHPFRDRSS